MTTKIREIRLRRGLTQEQLARRAKTTGATISRWETHPSRVTIPVLENLAKILDVSPADLLPGISRETPRKSGNVAMIHSLDDTRAVAFDLVELDSLTETSVELIAVLQVRGDAMAPTLHDGDRCLVDTSETEASSAGIYCLQMGRTAQVRRLSTNPVNGKINIMCDNKTYGDHVDVPPSAVNIIGKVIWVGHRLQ